MSTTKATLAKVASLAGVSKSQASDALRGSGRVSEESRRKVLAAAKELGYRTDSSARSLRSGSSRLIAIHLDPASTQDGEGGLLPFWSRFVTSFVFTVESYGYRTVLDVGSTHDQMFELPASAVIFVSTTEVAVEVPSNSGFGRIVSFFGARQFGSPDHATLIDCSHDYVQIGSDLAAHFAQAGAGVVLILRRPGQHAYQDAIETQLSLRLAASGIDVISRQSDGSTQDQVLVVVDALEEREIDGVFNLGGSLSNVVGALRLKGLEPAESAGRGSVVVVNQADTLGDQIGLGVITLLKLEGGQMGMDIGDHIVAAISGRPTEHVTFKHALAAIDQR